MADSSKRDIFFTHAVAIYQAITDYPDAARDSQQSDFATKNMPISTKGSKSEVVGVDETHKGTRKGTRRVRTLRDYRKVV